MLYMFQTLRLRFVYLFEKEGKEGAVLRFSAAQVTRAATTPAEFGSMSVSKTMLAGTVLGSLAVLFSVTAWSSAIALFALSWWAIPLLGMSAALITGLWRWSRRLISRDTRDVYPMWAGPRILGQSHHADAG